MDVLGWGTKRSTLRREEGTLRGTEGNRTQGTWKQKGVTGKKGVSKKTGTEVGDRNRGYCCTPEDAIIKHTPLSNLHKSAAPQSLANKTPDRRKEKREEKKNW